MSYEVRPLDLTQFRGDAIVNSLGIKENIKVYGGICRSIVRCSKSNDLKKEIESHEKEAVPGFMFATKGYSLPAKNIIHIVTPFFSHDNELFGLEYVYKLALVFALKNKWYKLGLPIIGTGANGYPHSYVLKMVTKLVGSFSQIHPEMKITICVPIVTLDDYKQKFDQQKIEDSINKFFKNNEGLEHREFNYDKSSFEKLEYFDALMLEKYSVREIMEAGESDIDVRSHRNPKRNNEYRLVTGGNGFLDWDKVVLDGGKRPVEFDMTELPEKSVNFYIQTYITKRFESESDQKYVRSYVNKVLSGDNSSTSLKSKHGIEEKRTTISVPVLMRYILALHMDENEAKQFLSFCGRTFSPVSKEDQTYLKLIKLKKYVYDENDIYKINGYCNQEKINQIFDYIKPRDSIIVSW